MVFASVMLSALSIGQAPAVLSGVDVLERSGFQALIGRNVALITNHTGKTADGRSTVDVLFEALGGRLKALFAPEHGIRGDLDERIPDGKDPRTGLPVYSLYNPGTGEQRYQPTSAQLEGVDTLVFDIQDIGARFYTYVGTLGYAMKAAASRGIRVVVLDRPNPIGGQKVEGPVADKERLGLTAFHPIPVRHGMTAGELAGLFKDELKLNVELQVIWCEGWRRDMWWDQTGLTWVNPSPNMRSVTQATLYPGICLVEATNVSVGRGTDTPFEWVGAPWLDGPKIANALNARNIPGVRFYPVRFRPNASKHEGVDCGGVAFLVTERDKLDAVRVGCELAHALKTAHPEWDTSCLVNLLQNSQAAATVLESGYEAAYRQWKAGLDEFVQRRKKYLHYR